MRGRLGLCAALLATCFACGDDRGALEDGDPLHEHGIKLPPAASWQPPEAKAPAADIQARPPPLSAEVFPCSRCHVGGPEVVDTAPAVPHQAHLAKDLECADCHGEDDPEIPAAEVCFDCHDDIPNDTKAVQEYFARTKAGMPRRWKTKGLIFDHGRHGKVKCAECHGQPSDNPFTKPKPLVLMRQCSDCHEKEQVAAECSTCHTEPMKPGYHEIELNHAEDQRGCLDCHNPDDRDTLRLANGTAVPFTESYRLCGQCHGTKLRDWKDGLHGKRTGMWDGQKEYLLCVHCHRDPHAPQIPTMKPDAPPTRPEDVK